MPQSDVRQQKLAPGKFDILNIEVFTIYSKYCFSAICSNVDRDQLHKGFYIEPV